MRALVRQFVELAIADGLTTARHLIGDFVWLGAGVDRRMGHRAPRAQFIRKQSACEGSDPSPATKMESRGASSVALIVPALVRSRLANVFARWPGREIGRASCRERGE